MAKVESTALVLRFQLGYLKTHTDHSLALVGEWEGCWVSHLMREVLSFNGEVN